MSVVKKFLTVLMTLALLVSGFALAEAPEAVVLDYNCDLANYGGTWNLTQAYTPDGGLVDVADAPAVVELEVMTEPGKLVDEAAYIHADALYLKGTMTCTVGGEEYEYDLSTQWSGFSVAIVHGEGDYEQHGANKLKVKQDDDEPIFLEEMTGLTSEAITEDEEYPSAIGLNAAGQLVIGYSEDHIENDEEATFAYALIFTKA